jgi:hypothetical protein
MRFRRPGGSEHGRIFVGSRPKSGSALMDSRESSKRFLAARLPALSMLSLLVTMTFAISALPAVFAQSGTSAACPDGVAVPEVPPVSSANATALALTSAQFREDVSGDTYTLGGVAVAAHCGKVLSIDANFIVTNSTGAREDLVVAFGASPSNIPVNVSNIQTFPAISAQFGESVTRQNWAGYQFCNNSGGGAYCPTTPSTAATDTYLNFTQPNIYVPTGTGAPSCGSGSSECSLAIWTALDTSNSSSAYILQTGSWGQISSGTTNYYLWWEDLESSSSTATLCTSLLGSLISPGNQIDANVLLNSGSSYYLSSYDVTNGNSCAANPNPYTFNHTPYYEDFEFERVSVSGTLTHLAKFDTTTASGQVVWSGTTYPISRPYGDGWYQQATMQNSGQINACSGTWSSPTCSASVTGGINANTYGSFTTTWVSSHYA